jgi:hypothetical protein
MAILQLAALIETGSTCSFDSVRLLACDRQKLNRQSPLPLKSGVEHLCGLL